ncbi:MAG: hypothetical protein Q9208_002852 [Pyrenodesmia sp. 3 TL-2023]
MTNRDGVATPTQCPQTPTAEGASLETTVHETDHDVSAKTAEDTALQRGIAVIQGLHIEGAVDQGVPTTKGAPRKGTPLPAADHQSDDAAALSTVDHLRLKGTEGIITVHDGGGTTADRYHHTRRRAPGTLTDAIPGTAAFHHPLLDATDHDLQTVPKNHDGRNPRPRPRHLFAAFTSTSHPPNNTSALTAHPTPPPPQKKLQPNYAPTGLLAAETNTVAHTSIILKYHEPPSARLPPASPPHLLYIFKSSDLLSTLPLHERSCWLFGREKMVADVAIEHPSCSKQHAVLQFRWVVRRDDEGGEERGKVGLYVLDLDSANGTRVNGERVEGRRYVEVRSKDVLRFGESEREYVVLVPPKEK